jgi:hypothetical protein
MHGPLKVEPNCVLFSHLLDYYTLYSFFKKEYCFTYVHPQWDLCEADAHYTLKEQKAPWTTQGTVEGHRTCNTGLKCALLLAKYNQNLQILLKLPVLNITKIKFVIC